MPHCFWLLKFIMKCHKLFMKCNIWTIIRLKFHVDWHFMFNNKQTKNYFKMSMSNIQNNSKLQNYGVAGNQDRCSATGFRTRPRVRGREKIALQSVSWKALPCLPFTKEIREVWDTWKPWKHLCSEITLRTLVQKHWCRYNILDAFVLFFIFNVTLNNIPVPKKTMVYYN